MATTVSSLERKTNEEISSLRLKLKNQLQKDIFRLYSDSLFADIVINVENETVKLHRCILETRVPNFYSTLCQKPNLLKKVIPDQILKIFFREIYCDDEIRSREEDLLKCLDSAFAIEKPINAERSVDFEQSNYFSINDSGVSTSTKLHLFKDISKSTTCVNRNFRNSNNSVYYSLVDESLILGDFSDINEEASKGMSGLDDLANSMTTEVANQAFSTVDDSETERIDEKTNAIDTIQTTLVEHINIDDLLLGEEKADEPEKVAPRKFFTFDGNENSDACPQRKIRKFFIDASDLIDEEASSGDKVSSIVESTEFQTTLSQPQEPRIESERTFSLHRTRLLEKQTPDSLDDDPHANNTCSKEYPSADLHNKLENDFLQASMVEKNEIVLDCNVTSPSKTDKNDERSSLSTSTPAISFFNFRTFLTEKYECAKKNHAYSDEECQRLKIFDELVQKDNSFTYLKCHLEDIVASGANKTQIAMHKFLVKQYEKHHEMKTTCIALKAFMIDMLRKQDDAVKKKFDPMAFSLNDYSERLYDDSVDVDELFKKLLVVSTSDEKHESSKVASKKDPVTSKSCGFFIDLTESPKPNCEAKEKSLPSKQLFSMFIDFGNSTDSDSSVGVHNKFERRKKQYISKLEKSRELRSSVTSLNDGEGRKLEKIVQSMPLACNVSTTVESLIEDMPTVIGCDASSGVVRRCKKNSSQHPPTIRRSWNVDKTSEINQNTITKHKRSCSVSANHENIKTSHALDVNLNRTDSVGEFPSIGNADSTNELTVNGESEMSNSHSYSEGGDSKIRSNISNYVSTEAYSNGVVLKSDESCSKGKDKDKVFVKLSDMDKEPKTLSSTDHWSSVRMTKSAIGTETSWFETKLLNGLVNSRSLSRIFPDLSASVLSKPNSDVDDTTISSMSSVQSSSAVSTCESNLEFSNNASKIDNNSLGQDLLKMFLDEISTDVVVEVAGRRIKAHKCILTSRCQYFAALLSGGWVESAGNVLSMHGFSYNVVHFALCYIYSGESEIPENISIVELASLADYLCLEGLKEVVSCTLRIRYCHLFHKPCNVCSVGVLECLPIAVNYGLDDIHHKSLRWITKHYVRLWCSKAFATLPRELIDKCYNQHVVNITVNTVFETLTSCDKLFSSIPQARWAEPCFAVTKKLHDYCIKFLANRFVDFLKSDAFVSIATNCAWGINIMDEKTQLVCGKMRSDQLCQCYAYLSAQCKLAMASHENEELIELLNRVKRHIETTLVKIALQACQCSAWFQMDPELRNHIQTSAGLTFVPSEAKRRVETFKSRSATVSASSRGVDLQQVKTVINRQQKQSNNLRTHEPRPVKQSTNHQKLNVHGRGTSTNKQTGSQNKENKGAKGLSHGNSKSPFRSKYSNVKSRYMDHKSGKNDRNTTASETTPSETSEVEKRVPSSNKRSSKSLASSVHLSPGASIRQTARAVSLSKIPVSVRNSSQKRTESDRDTTSSSDNGRGTSSTSCANGIVDNRRPASSRTTSGGATRSANLVTSSRASHTQGATRKSYSSSGTHVEVRGSRNSARTPVTAASGYRRKSMTNGTAASANIKRANGIARRRINLEEFSSKSPPTVSRSNDGSPDTKCPSNPSSSKTSMSEEICRPDVPFRRDGTFCIDEPTVLKKKNSPSSDQTEIV